MKIVSMFNVELMKKKILTAEFGLMTVVIRTEKCHWLGIVQYKVLVVVQVFYLQNVVKYLSHIWQVSKWIKVKGRTKKDRVLEMVT